MEGNQSEISEFILVGFQLTEDMELLVFGIFTLLYTFNLLANGMILGLIVFDPRLHSPMYLFLSHLALNDMFCASSNLPNLLANLANTRKPSPLSHAICRCFLCWVLVHYSVWVCWRYLMTGMWRSAIPSSTRSSWTGECAPSWPSLAGHVDLPWPWSK